MSAERPSFIDIGYDAQLRSRLVVDAVGVARATMRAAEVALSVRNVAMGFVDQQGRAHPVVVGGVAFSSTLEALFWSSPHTEHARIIGQTGKGSMMPFDSNANAEYMRLKDVHIREVPPDETTNYIDTLNAARARHGIAPRGIDQFGDSRQHRRLYVATPSGDPALTTVPVSAYYADMVGPEAWNPEAADQAWAKDIHYPADPLVLRDALVQLEY